MPDGWGKNLGKDFTIINSSFKSESLEFQYDILIQNTKSSVSTPGRIIPIEVFLVLYLI